MEVEVRFAQSIMCSSVYLVNRTCEASGRLCLLFGAGRLDSETRCSRSQDAQPEVIGSFECQEDVPSTRLVV